MKRVFTSRRCAFGLTALVTLFWVGRCSAQYYERVTLTTPQGPLGYVFPVAPIYYPWIYGGYGGWWGPYAGPVNFPPSYGVPPIGPGPRSYTSTPRSSGIVPAAGEKGAGGISPAVYEPSPDPNRATVDVRAPAEAEVKVQGENLENREGSRRFFSPSLKPGLVYPYTVSATWKKGGKDVTLVQAIKLQAGDHQGVSFFPPASSSR